MRAPRRALAPRADRSGEGSGALTAMRMDRFIGLGSASTPKIAAAEPLTSALASPMLFGPDRSNRRDAGCLEDCCSRRLRRGGWKSRKRRPPRRRGVERPAGHLARCARICGAAEAHFRGVSRLEFPFPQHTKPTRGRRRAQHPINMHQQIVCLRTQRRHIADCAGGTLLMKLVGGGVRFFRRPPAPKHTQPTAAVPNARAQPRP